MFSEANGWCLFKDVFILDVTSVTSKCDGMLVTSENETGLCKSKILNFCSKPSVSCIVPSSRRHYMSLKWDAAKALRKSWM